jgi:transcriptional regulator with XRE-family HTH domain
MKIDAGLTDEAVLAELGRRLARTRLERNLTQAQLGEEAGVGLATVQRLEAGRAVKLPSLVRVLRTLGLLDALDVLVPEPAPSPIELLKLHGRQRQRAAHPRSVGKQPSEAAWVWGDERGGGE